MADVIMKGLSSDQAMSELRHILHICDVGLRTEILFATMRHGILRNPDRSIAILTEEVGEAAHEVIELKEPGARERAFCELMQVAAVAMRLAVQIKEDRWRTK